MKWFETSILTPIVKTSLALEYAEDEAVEDNLFQENDIDVFPGEKSEN